MTLPLVHIPGDAETAGAAHGVLIRDLVQPAFLEAYITSLADAIGFEPDRLEAQALAWLGSLPSHFAAEVGAMADGAGVRLGDVARLLFADIAPSAGSRTPHGPMCSAVCAQLHDDRRWVGRNCDWLTPTLMRGVAAVVHETPHRIPIMAVGIRGDIDVDTGINAEGLWLHLHTLHATDPVPDDARRISWLFWAREALETCASLDDLERFIAATARDRGVMAVACEGSTGRAAVFECGRARHIRHDVTGATPLCVTNHTLTRPDRPVARRSANASGTVSRRQTLRSHLNANPPTRGPDDLVASLAAEGVEMRTPRWLRTIYSAVADARSQTVWFASGTPTGQPAASTGTWTSISPPWLGRRSIVR